jgi:hypothetical protein
MGTTETWRVTCYRLDHRSMSTLPNGCYAHRMLMAMLVAKLVKNPPDYLAIGVALLGLSLMLRRYAR